MNGLWIKVAIGIAVLIGTVVVISKILPSDLSSVTETKSFYDVVEEDQKKFHAEPDVQPNQPDQTTRQTAQATKEPNEPQPETTNKQPQKQQTAKKSQFTELTPAEEADAQRQFEVAAKQFDVGRLTRSYKPTVDACRRIIERYPNSKYAYKARVILGEIPRRYRKRYDITEEEVKLDR